MIYLTYADQPSGVFSSQVIDVCHYINSLNKKKIRLVAFISFHGFNKNKAKIKAEMPHALVLPMFPKMTWFSTNAFILLLVLLFTGERSIVARNVLGCNIANSLKKILTLKVCFDGRGAIAAEWNEYNVVPFPAWKEAIHQWEKQSVLQSDFHIAVSSELVNYWQQRYQYNSNQHVIIPCTLNSGFKAHALTAQEINTTRQQIGFGDDDIVLVYSGSTAGWQSFDLLKTFLSRVLMAEARVKVLFLSEQDKNVDALKALFPGRILQRFVSHKEVTSILTACDYGILIREKSVTNQVASPTKFAEYLSAGLPVIISEGIGDYSAFVKTHSCGVVLSSEVSPPLAPNTLDERNRYVRLVTDHYSKQAQTNNYLKLMDEMR